RPGPGAHPTDPDPVEAEVRLTDVRVLVVDDEADVREAVSRMLVQRGAQVTALASGREVERVLAEFRPDVLLVDISMPDEDGYGLIRRVRSLPPGAGGGTPALSLTAHARDADRARALAAGFQGHLAKPVDLGGLVAAIRAQVRAGAAAEAPAQPGDGSRG
ncbi:MAG: response regulator, partial [Myxococcota bacterium]